MSSDPIYANDRERVVFEFLHAMGPTAPDVQAAYEKYLADDCVWENTGFPPCEGKQAILEFLAVLLEMTGFVRVEATFRNLASKGDIVLSERVDDMIKADGSRWLRFPIMGTMRVGADGLIHEWRDYFNPMEAVQAIMGSPA
jgi:limonene-1,2-epoxide hydrolase